MFEEGSLSEHQHLQRAAFLLALATGYRASQLAALTRHDAFSSVAEDGASLKLTPSPTFLAKNEQADSFIGPIEIPTLLQSGTPHPLCPVAAFKDYIACTQDLSKDHLFYASRSARPLTARSLARLL